MSSQPAKAFEQEVQPGLPASMPDGVSKASKILGQVLGSDKFKQPDAWQRAAETIHIVVMHNEGLKSEEVAQALVTDKAMAYFNEAAPNTDAPKVLKIQVGEQKVPIVVRIKANGVITWSGENTKDVDVPVQDGF